MIVAITVSVVAAFTGLALTRRIGALPDWTRKTLVAMSAVVIGGGIWTMHFLAMLANKFSVPVGYDVVTTLISGLVSILMVGMALLVLHFSTRTPNVLSVAGFIFAAGIISMHYIGMSAMRGAVPEYTLFSIFLSAIAAPVFCTYAIHVAYGKRSKETIVSGGLLLGLSVVVVHYTAMAGIQYTASRGHDDGTIAMHNSSLAIVLVFAVFLICAAFLLVSATFLTTPERSDEHSVPISVDPVYSARSLTESAENTLSDNSSPADHSGHVDNKTAAASRIAPEFSKPAQPTSNTQNANNSDTTDHKKRNSNTDNQDTELELRIPYEHNRKISFIDHRTIGAIRADGRYTHLYTQQRVYFCPWSITEAEKKLSGTPFYRSHRSYLVNITKMTSYEKRKDSAICLFEGYDQLTKVPVSRTRVAGLLQRLGLD